jgi:hypothetical protein
MAYTSEFSTSALSDAEKNIIWTAENIERLEAQGILQGADAAAKKTAYFAEHDRLLTFPNSFIWKYLNDGEFVGFRLLVEPKKIVFELGGAGEFNDIEFSSCWSETPIDKMITVVWSICYNPKLIALDANYADTSMVTMQGLMTEAETLKLWEENSDVHGLSNVDLMMEYMKTIGKDKSFIFLTGNTQKAFHKNQLVSEGNGDRVFQYNQIAGCPMIVLGVTNQASYYSSLTTPNKGWDLT